MMFWSSLMGFLTSIALAAGHIMNNLYTWQILFALVFVALWSSFVPALVGMAVEHSKWMQKSRAQLQHEEDRAEIARLKALCFDEHEAKIKAENQWLAVQPILREIANSGRGQSMRIQAVLAGHLEEGATLKDKR